jgi:glycosyltransferase involved in cell wall biosynthesis
MMDASGHPKVLFIVTRLDRGGVPEVLLPLAERLKARGFDLELASGRTRNPPTALDDFTDRSGIPILRVPFLQRSVSPIRDALAWRSIRRLIRRRQPAIVHTHTSKAGFLGRLAAHRLRCPAVVHSPHGHLFYGYASPAVTQAYVQLERAAAAWCHRICTLTEESIRSHLARGIGREEQYVAIPGGIELERFARPSRGREEVRREFGLPPEAPVVGWIGRLEPVKGGDLFLQALREVRARHPQVRAIIVGEGSRREALAALAKELRLSDAVTFTGYREDIPDLMHAFTVYALTSRNEGLGRTILEAMACGVPVVATRVGGVPEVVEDGISGLLTSPDDTGALAAAMLDALVDPELRRRLSEGGLRRVQHFTLDRMVDQTAALYEELLKT